jgi:hypothetical protein
MNHARIAALNNQREGLMSDDVPPSRTARLIKAAAANTSKTSKTNKAAMTPQESRELLQLYAELPNASSAALQARRIASETPTGSALQKFKELDARLEAIISRINEILG